MSIQKNHEPLDERAVRKLLEHPEQVEPPADLLQALKDEIPPELPAAGGETSRRTIWSRPALQIAAAIAVLLAAGLLTVRLRQQQAATPLGEPPPEASRLGDRQVAEDPRVAQGSVDSASTVAPRATEARLGHENDGPRGQVAQQELHRDGPMQLNAKKAFQAESGRRAAAAPPEAKDELFRQSSAPPSVAEPAAEGRVFYDQRADLEGAATSVGDRDDGAHGSAKTAGSALRERAESETAEIVSRPAEIVSRPAEIVSRPAEIVSRPAGIAGPKRVLEEAVSAPTSPPVREAAVADRVTSPARPPSDIAPEPPRVRPPEPDTMIFRDAGTNPYTDPAIDPRSTFGLDVDTASYTLARTYLERELLPPPASIRLEEWVNAFDYGDPAPRTGAFALTIEGARAPYGSANRYLVRIGIRARDLDELERQPAALTFLVDTSGSMAREGRLELVKRSLFLLLDELRPDDTVALVTYGSRGRVVLPPTWDKVAIRRAVEQLHPQGSTNLEEGLQLAYELASRNHRREAIDRIVLLSDGVANVGVTEPMALLESIADWAARGIELTAVGVGMGNYNDALLEQLADRGDGAYAYVDSLEEARKVFVENLTGTLQTLAADARMQVRFDPEVVARYRLLGYENRDLPDEAFRDPRTDAGEIGYGHRVSALYEVELRPGVARRAPVLEATLRYRSVETGEFEEVTTSLRRGRSSDAFEDAPASLRLASVAAEFAEILKQAPSAERLDRLFRRSQQLVPEFPGRSDVTELVSAIGRARDLARHGAR